MSRWQIIAWLGDAAFAGLLVVLAGIRRRRPRRMRCRWTAGFVRRPIYLGWMLLVFAAPLMTVNRALFALISSSYLILAIPWEETSLAAAHGDRYREYQRQVRWRVFPGMW